MQVEKAISAGAAAANAVEGTQGEPHRGSPGGDPSAYQPGIQNEMGISWEQLGTDAYNDAFRFIENYQRNHQGHKLTFDYEGLQYTFLGRQADGSIKVEAPNHPGEPKYLVIPINQMQPLINTLYRQIAGPDWI